MRTVKECWFGNRKVEIDIRIKPIPNDDRIKKMDRKMECLFKHCRELDINRIFENRCANSHEHKELVKYAREEVGYADSSCECDILASLDKAYDVMCMKGDYERWHTGY